jgi:hypothetical protein
MDNDPAIASQKLQTDLLAVQNWFKKWRMIANESKSIHVTFTIRRETLVHINNVQLPQEEEAQVRAVVTGGPPNMVLLHMEAKKMV